jgi:hypothetical protein
VLLGVAVVVNPEVAPNAVEEQTSKRCRQTGMFLFKNSQCRPEIHKSARGRLHGEKHLRAVWLVFALAPFMWVCGKRHRKFERLIDFRFSVAPYETIESAPQELRRFPGTRFPIGWIRNSEFDQDSGKASRCCVTTE